MKLRLLSALPVLVAIGGLVGCASFESEDPLAEMVPRNECTVHEDCTDGNRCLEGICVARGTPEEQSIALRITPAYQTDGTDPLPIPGLLRLDGPTARKLMLPRPVSTSVTVTRGGEPVAATIRIRYVAQLPGVPVRSRSVLLADDMDTASVVLHEGSTYTIRVEPTDTSLPPLTRQVDDVTEGLETIFDYDEETFERSYLVLGEINGPPLLVRAVDPTTKRAVSSVAETSDSSLITLTFAGDEAKPAPYVLELSPPTETKEELVAESDNDCDVSAIRPSYHVASEDLVDASIIPIVLPKVLSPIRYEGTVELCGDGEAVLTTENAQTLGVSLRSTSLVLQEGADSTTPVVATYVVETATSIDNGTHRFCATALPGMYEVVVNPPAITGNCLPSEDVARCGCGIFAETRALEPRDETEDAEPVQLKLPTMASISGALTTEGEAPVVGATIEAAALSNADDIDLGDADRGVIGYNRSAQGTSGMGGRFRLPLDVGAYDITIKPPAESGFAWLVLRDIGIASRSEEFSQVLTMVAPISVDGTLQYEGGANASEQASLAGAVIRAYGIVEEADDPSTRRAIQVGQTTADESGRFKLLVSPVQPRQGWWP